MDSSHFNFAPLHYTATATSIPSPHCPNESDSLTYRWRPTPPQLNSHLATLPPSSSDYTHLTSQLPPPPLASYHSSSTHSTASESPNFFPPSGSSSGGGGGGTGDLASLPMTACPWRQGGLTSICVSVSTSAFLLLLLPLPSAVLFRIYCSSCIWLLDLDTTPLPVPTVLFFLFIF